MDRVRFRGIWLVPAALVADRLFKAWAARAGRAFDILPGVLGFRYAENTGAAFSIFSGNTAILAVLTAILIVCVSLYLFLGKDIPRPARYALWLVVAGGLGNLYDRAVYGYVVDFLEFQFMNFAIFNFADVCVSCGAVFAIACFLFEDRKKGGAHGGDDPVSG